MKINGHTWDRRRSRTSPERRGLQAAGSSKCSSPRPAAVPAPPITSPLENAGPHSLLTSMVCAWRAASQRATPGHSEGWPWVSWASSPPWGSWQCWKSPDPVFLRPSVSVKVKVVLSWDPACRWVPRGWSWVRARALSTHWLPPHPTWEGHAFPSIPFCPVQGGDRQTSCQTSLCPLSRRSGRGSKGLPGAGRAGLGPFPPGQRAGGGPTVTPVHCAQLGAAHGRPHRGARIQV